MPASTSSSSSEMPGPSGGVDEPGADQGAGVNAARLQLRRSDSVVAGHRMGEHHDLSGIGWIGQDLAPAGGGSGEDEVALGRGRGATQDAALDACRPRAQASPGAERGTDRVLAAGASECCVNGRDGLHLSLLPGITVPVLKDRGGV